MNKVKQIFSHNDDRDVSPRNSTSSAQGYDTTEPNSTSRNWALGAVGKGHDGDRIHTVGDDGANTRVGGTTSTAESGLAAAEGKNVHSGATGVGSNIGRDSDRISGGHGVGNAATTAGREYETGRQGSGLSGNSTGLSGRDTTTTGTTGLNRTNVGSTGTTGAGLTGDRNLESDTTRGSTGQGFVGKLTGNHSIGHDSRDTTKFDPQGENTHHDHKHLQHVVHATHRHAEVEEVERQRQVDRHVHHLQHHVQPVRDQVINDETQANVSHPVTNITEHHVNTDDDIKLFQSLGEKHRDHEQHLPKERTVVDLGEKVNTVTHHHVHHVTQPVVEREIHDRHRIHTVIPTTHTVHEAPIIHKSSVHEPVHMADFLKGGGKLDSGITHDKSGLLATGECDREVDGVGERLVNELNLKPSSFGSHGATGTTTTGTGSNLNRDRELGTTGSNVSSTGNRDNRSGLGTADYSSSPAGTEGAGGFRQGGHHGNESVQTTSVASGRDVPMTKSY